MAEGNIRARTRWTSLWQTLGLIFALYVLEQDVESILWSMRLQPNAGWIGAFMYPAPEFARGYVVVQGVVPRSPLAGAGVADGDHLSFDRSFEYLRIRPAGEVVHFTLDHRGQKSERSVSAGPRTTMPVGHNSDTFQLVNGLSSVVPLLLGAFVLWRCRGRRAALLLGTVLVQFGWLYFVPQLWVGQPQHFAALYVLHVYLCFSIGMLFPGFAMCFVEETHGALRPWQWQVYAAYCVSAVVCIAIYEYCTLNIATLPIVSDARVMLTLYALATFAFTIYYLISGWRRSGRETQKRYALMLTAFMAIIVAQAITVVTNLLFRIQDPAANPIIWFGIILTGVVAPGLFTYSIFRHKVFDLGFAINRALVYGIISTGLLVTFGLIEWVSEHLLPFNSLETNALLNAGVALTLFLVFHRVRDAVERVVEKLLFRRWQYNETTLRRFVKEASFIGKGETLDAATVAELRRFAGGADCALYALQDGDYQRVSGAVAGVTDRLDGDEPVAVALRAEHSPVELTDTRSTLPAALALPMVHRAELSGFLLLGAKPSGDSYRPDEREVLGWAAREIGLDRHALKLAQWEAQAAAQTQELAVLRARCDEQRLALDHARPLGN